MIHRCINILLLICINGTENITFMKRVSIIHNTTNTSNISIDIQYTIYKHCAASSFIHGSKNPTSMKYLIYYILCKTLNFNEHLTHSCVGMPQGLQALSSSLTCNGFAWIWKDIDFTLSQGSIEYRRCYINMNMICGYGGWWPFFCHPLLLLYLSFQFKSTLHGLCGPEDISL